MEESDKLILKSRCKRCGKLLRSEESVKLGYGPICYKRVKITGTKPLFELGEMKDV